MRKRLRMRMLNLTQNSEEWLQARRGKVTASSFSKIITPAKGDKSTSATVYAYEIIAELMGAENESFSNGFTEMGHEREDDARSVFEFITDLKVDQVGMIVTDCERIGCSPDGLIGDDGGLEIKCPKASTHIKYLLDGTLPLEYKTQVQGSLMVSERDFWYFMSYHPQLPPFILKVERDEEFIAKMQSHINDFLSDVEIKIKKLGYKNVTTN